MKAQFVILYKKKKKKKANSLFKKVHIGPYSYVSWSFFIVDFSN